MKTLVLLFVVVLALMFTASEAQDYPTTCTKLIQGDTNITTFNCKRHQKCCGPISNQYCCHDWDNDHHDSDNDHHDSDNDHRDSDNDHRDRDNDRHDWDNDRHDSDNDSDFYHRRSFKSVKGIIIAVCVIGALVVIVTIVSIVVCCVCFKRKSACQRGRVVQPPENITVYPGAMNPGYKYPVGQNPPLYGQVSQPEATEEKKPLE